MPSLDNTPRTTAAVSLTQREVLALTIAIDSYEEMILRDLGPKRSVYPHRQDVIDAARSAAEKITAAFSQR